MASMPTEANTASNDEVNLASRSRTKKRSLRPACSSSPAKLRRDLGHPCLVRVGTYAEEVQDPTLDLEHEEDVVAPEQDGLDGEEVGGQEALRLGPEELHPAWARPVVVREAGRGLGERWRRRPSARDCIGQGGAVWRPVTSQLRLCVGCSALLKRYVSGLPADPTGGRYGGNL